MLNTYVNKINVTIYKKKKQEIEYKNICFAGFSIKAHKAYKAHYKLNNDLILNQELIKDYLTIWNSWKQTKNWFNIDKIIADNGLVWSFNQGLHKVNTKICILRFIDENSNTVTKITKHINNYPPEILIKVLLSEAHKGHSFVYNYKPNLTFKKDTRQYKETKSMNGIHGAWDTNVMTPYEELSAKEKKILQ